MKASVLLLVCALLSGCGRPSGLFGLKLGKPVPADCMVLVSWTNKPGGSVVLDVAPPRSDPLFTKYCVTVSNNAVCGITAFCASPEAAFKFLVNQFGKASGGGEGFMVWTNGSRIAGFFSEKGGGRVTFVDRRLLAGAPWQTASEAREWELTMTRMKEEEAAGQKRLDEMDRELKKSTEESKLEEARAKSNAVALQVDRVALDIAGGIVAHVWTFKAGGQFAGYFDSIRGTNIMVRSESGVFALPIALLTDDDQALVSRIKK